MTTPMTSPFPTPSHGGRLVPTEGRTLPLTGAGLSVDARGGLGRVRFTQTFANAHDEPLHVTYRLPLPADAAVGGFVFHVGDERIVGRVMKKAIARETFEQALAEGKSAALLEQERSSLFSQEIGNVPPRTEVKVEITLDVPLAWLDTGAWELRFPLAAAPRYLGAEAEALANVVVDVASAPIAARASLELAIRDELVAGRSPESPSHPLQCKEVGGAWRVELGSGNRVELDRDVVVRWPVAILEPKVSLDVARPAPSSKLASAFGLLTIVPPARDARPAKVTRAVTLLIDTSGSMHGSPLEQAKRISSAIVDSLDDGDSLEMIEFSNAANAYKPGSVPATKAERRAALAWIGNLEASGGTEMVSGVRAALAPLTNGSQRQIVLITDGLIGCERHVVSALLSGLPPSSRFHAVGVGAAANRSLLMPVARAGRGIEAIVNIGEDAEPAAKRLLSRMAEPIVVDLVIEGSAVKKVSPARLPDLFGATPARVLVELASDGGELVVRGRTAGGAYELRIAVPASEQGEGNASIVRLFARESVEDVETRVASGEARAALDAEIERLGLEHGISTRLTSFVAVTEKTTVDPGEPTRRETMPQVLPFGMSAEGLGLRPSDRTLHTLVDPFAAMAAPQARAMPSSPSPIPAPAAPRAMREKARSGRMGGDDRPGFGAPPTGAPPPPPARAAESKPAPAKDDAGLVDRVRRFFSGAPEKKEAAEERAAGKPAAPPAFAEAAKGKFFPAPPPAETESGGEPSKTARALRIVGRITMKRGSTLVLEIAAPEEAISFDPSAFASIVAALAGGGEVHGHVDAARSTKKGSYARGLVLRIAIELDAPLATDVASITLDAGDFVVEAS